MAIQTSAQTDAATEIAVAIVDGSWTTCPLTIGAAPEAWKPNIFGSWVELAASRSSR